jgi:hypothetical protein
MLRGRDGLCRLEVELVIKDRRRLNEEGGVVVRLGDLQNVRIHVTEVDLLVHVLLNVLIVLKTFTKSIL